MIEFLSSEELFQITGYKADAYQVAFLKEEGWPHTVTCEGKPRVARRYAEMKYGLLDEPKSSGISMSPDWDVKQGAR